MLTGDQMLLQGYWDSCWLRYIVMIALLRTFLERAKGVALSSSPLLSLWKQLMAKRRNVFFGREDCAIVCIGSYLYSSLKREGDPWTNRFRWAGNVDSSMRLMRPSQIPLTCLGQPWSFAHAVYWSWDLYFCDAAEWRCPVIRGRISFSYVG